ncbi:MAG: macro domain-containing protein [Propionibacteriaceae bacterium]|jgi:O-acetyl-ADP-ribose deacetylase (regulator of RNase III)|nr:macro domain-containing protein [Propionibacteriaceae bacterium]
MQILIVKGDITTIPVDAMVNAASPKMRGGGGVDGAIHRAGGPAVLADCIRRFPAGLAAGEVGWTTAGRLPAQWVIHAVGPNLMAGQTDRQLLESCYRRCLQVADRLGAPLVSFPLISAGTYGWPLADAAETAVTTVINTPCQVQQVIFVAYSDEARDALNAVASRLSGGAPA